MAPGFFGCSVLRNSVHSEFYRSLPDTCEIIDLPSEGLHEETEPGVLEAAKSVGGAEAAAGTAGQGGTHGQFRYPPGSRFLGAHRGEPGYRQSVLRAAVTATREWEERYFEII